MKIKKIITTLTALATLAITNPIQSSAYCGELYAGDADHDGYITSADASIILREAAQIATGHYPTMEKYFLDANYDGKVTPADASMVLREYSRVSTLPRWAAKYEPFYHWHDDDTFIAYVNGELIPCIDIMISNDRGVPFAQFIDHNGAPYVAVESNFQYDIDVCYWEYVE